MYLHLFTCNLCNSDSHIAVFISGYIGELLTLPYFQLFLGFTFNDKEDYILKECVNTPDGTYTVFVRQCLYLLCV